MADAKKKRQQPKKPPADSPKIPKMLAEARQMVDDLDRASPPPQKTPRAQKAAGTATRSKTGAAQKPVPRKKAPAARKTASRPQIPPSPAREATASWVAAPLPGPRRSPMECGIRVVHVLPGRVRFRIRSLKFNPQFAEKVEQKLATLTGVTEVAASSATGSVLIRYGSKGLMEGPLREALETWFPSLDTDMLLASLPS